MKLLTGILFLTLGFQNTFAGVVNVQGETADYGPIPDGNSQFYYRNYATPRDIRFNVGDQTGGSIRFVRVSFAANHTNMSDLRVTLIAPDGRYLVLFETLGSDSDSLFTSNLVSNNFYVFSDTLASNWWEAANIGDNDIGGGTYRTVVPVDTFPALAPDESSLNSMFKTADPEGTWTLRFEDGLANNTGDVVSAVLILDIEDFGVQTRVVTNTNDSGQGSLRQAILDANASDKIEFDIPDNQVAITLSTPLPDITNDLTIVGRPDNLILLQMFNRNGRIINIPEGHNNTVTINNLRFRNGGGVDLGGCINNGGRLFLTGSYVFNCKANDNGGGIFSTANSELYMINSGVSDNEAFYGAGISTNSNSKTWIIQSSIVNNIGTGIDIFSFENTTSLEIHNSSIVNNQDTGLIVGAQENSQSEVIFSNNLFSNSSDNIQTFQEIGSIVTITSKGFNLTTDDGNGHLVADSDKINANAGIESVETTLGVTVINLSDSSDAIDAGRSVAYFNNDLSGEPNARIVDFPEISNYFGSFIGFPDNVSGDGSDIGAFEKQSNDVIFQNGFE